MAFDKLGLGCDLRTFRRDRSLRPVTSTQLWVRGGVCARHSSDGLETDADAECRVVAVPKLAKSPSAQAAGGELHGQARPHACLW